MLIQVSNFLDGPLDISGLRVVGPGEMIVVPDEFAGLNNIKNATDAGLILLIPDKVYSASDGVSSTTSTTYQDKTILTTGSNTGSFWVEWSAELANTQSNANSWLTFINATDNIVINEVCPNFKNISGYLLFCGFVEVILSGSPKTFKIQFKADSGTAQIRNARIRTTRRV